VPCIDLHPSFDITSHHSQHSVQKQAVLLGCVCWKACADEPSEFLLCILCREHDQLAAILTVGEQQQHSRKAVYLSKALHMIVHKDNNRARVPSNSTALQHS
jgi:hypothetical protein